MNKSVLTIVRLVFFSLMLVVLVVLMILNITERGIGTGMDKILLALFVLLMSSPKIALQQKEQRNG